MKISSRFSKLSLDKFCLGCSKKQDNSLLIRFTKKAKRIDDFLVELFLPLSNWSTSKTVYKTLSKSLEMILTQLNLIIFPLRSEVSFEIKRMTLSGFTYPPFSDPRN
jgi:hypothetical protein